MVQIGSHDIITIVMLAISIRMRIIMYDAKYQNFQNKNNKNSFNFFLASSVIQLPHNTPKPGFELYCSIIWL